jgi:hypothetical protein
MRVATRSHHCQVGLLGFVSLLLTGCGTMYTEHVTVRSSIPSWAAGADKLIQRLAPEIPPCEKGQSAHLRVDARSGARYDSRYDELERDTTISRQAACR